MSVSEAGARTGNDESDVDPDDLSDSDIETSHDPIVISEELAEA